MRVQEALRKGKRPGEYQRVGGSKSLLPAKPSTVKNVDAACEMLNESFVRERESDGKIWFRTHRWK